MKIENIKVGDLETNCYILEKNNNVLLIDPGDESNKIIDKIGDRKLIGILITHNHFDHIGCVSDIVNDYKIDVYDNSNLDEGENNISIFKFKVIKTYGHTMDSISFYFDKDKVMFTGDFLFYNTIGRCDLNESREYEMKKSLEKIKLYEDEIAVYPGHGRDTTLGREKMYNVFFR